MNTQRTTGFTVGISIDPRLLFLVSYAIAFLGSKYLGLIPGYALDDYQIVSQTQDGGLWRFFISQGRYTAAVIDLVLDATGLDMTDFSVLSFIATIAFSGLFYMTALSPGPRQRMGMIAAAAAILGAHSYYTEYVTFRQSALPLSIMFALLWMAVVQYRRVLWENDHPRFRIALALVAGVIAMGVNQLALCLAAIAALCMHLSRQREILPADSGRSHAQSIIATIRPFAITIFVGAALSAGSLLLSAVVQAVFDISSNARASFISITDIPERLGKLLELTRTVLIGREPIASPLAKGLLLLGMLTLLAPLSGRELKHSARILLFALAGWAIALFPHLFSSTWWPVPRTLIAIPLVFSGVAMLADHGQHWRTSLAATLMISAAFLFGGHSNAVLLDQQRLNRWDMAQAWEIAYRVSERHPGKAKIAIVGGTWAYPLTPGMPQGDMNTSALSIGWAIDPLFDESTGMDMQVRAAPDLAGACEGKPSFPEQGSTLEQGEEILVCL